jgi:hypothetical protein
MSTPDGEHNHVKSLNGIECSQQKFVKFILLLLYCLSAANPRLHIPWPSLQASSTASHFHEHASTHASVEHPVAASSDRQGLTKEPQTCREL